MASLSLAADHKGRYSVNRLVARAWGNHARERRGRRCGSLGFLGRFCGRRDWVCGCRNVNGVWVGWGAMGWISEVAAMVDEAFGAIEVVRLCGRG